MGLENGLTKKNPSQNCYGRKNNSGVSFHALSSDWNACRAV